MDKQRNLLGKGEICLEKGKLRKFLEIGESEIGGNASLVLRGMDAPGVVQYYKNPHVCSRCCDGILKIIIIAVGCQHREREYVYDLRLRAI